MIVFLRPLGLGTTGSIYFGKVVLFFTGNSLQVLACIFFFAGNKAGVKAWWNADYVKS